jgi:hypothetical protein
MATIVKLTLVANFSGSPPGARFSPARQGGFTENFWLATAPTPAQINLWATLRASLMSVDSQFVGYRITPYTYAGNKATPGHAQIGYLEVGGKTPYGSTCNSPEDAFRIRCNAAAPYFSAFTQFLHSMPDAVIDSTVYQPNNAYTTQMNAWLNALTGQSRSGLVPLWFGRDPTQASARVVAVNDPANTITTIGAVQNVNVGSYIRLRRVYAAPGAPIKGTFLVTLITAPVVPAVNYVYTVVGLPDLVASTPSGTCRNDLLASATIANAVTSIMAERKIGRPTLLFRGRRSKQNP